MTGIPCIAWSLISFTLGMISMGFLFTLTAGLPFWTSRKAPDSNRDKP